MDIRMKDMSGPEARILILTIFSDDVYSIQALCRGDKGESPPTYSWEGGTARNYLSSLLKKLSLQGPNPADRLFYQHLQ